MLMKCSFFAREPTPACQYSRGVRNCTTPRASGVLTTLRLPVGGGMNEGARGAVNHKQSRSPRASFCIMRSAVAHARDCVARAACACNAAHRPANRASTLMTAKPHARVPSGHERPRDGRVWGIGAVNVHVEPQSRK